MANKKKGKLLLPDVTTRDVHLVRYTDGELEWPPIGRLSGTLREVRQFVESELEMPTGSYQLVRFYDIFCVEEVKRTQVNWMEHSDEVPTEDLEDPDIDF